MTRILLSTVTFPTTSYYQGPHNDTFPHIGLCSLSAVLSADGHEVHHVNPVVNGWSLRAYAQWIRELNPEIIGFSCYTQDMDNASYLAGILKKSLSNPFILVGGYHPSALPEKTLQEYTDLDGVICGEGERSALEFVRAIRAQSGLSGVAGLVFRQGDNIISNRPNDLIDDLDSLPYPEFDGLPLERFNRMYSFFKGVMLPINSARGCPYRCTFCHRIFGHRVRFRSAESLVGEMQRDVDTYRAKNFAFVTETFTVDQRRTLRLCEAIIASGLHRKTLWMCSTRIDSVTAELIKTMKRAGCGLIGFGIESGHQDILDNEKKDIDLSTVRRVFSWCHEAGIRVVATFILGHPNDTVETINRTMNFAVAANPTYVIYAIMTPYPGTEVARMAEKGECGVVLRNVGWAAYGKSIGEAWELKDVNRVTLERLQRKAYMKFFFRPTRIKSLFEMVKPRVLFRYAWHVVLVSMFPGIWRKGRHAGQS